MTSPYERMAELAAAGLLLSFFLSLSLSLSLSDEERRKERRKGGSVTHIETWGDSDRDGQTSSTVRE
jgi:hypothetical protein